MNRKTLKIGNIYRHCDNPAIGYAKALKVLPPLKNGNTTTKILVRCEWSMDETFVVGLIKHFKITDLVQP